MSAEQDHYARVAHHYDQLASHGPFGTLAPHNNGGRKAEYVAAVLDAALLPRLRQGAPHERILDYGCGTGILTRQIAALAHEVVGVDVSPGMLQLARDVCDGLPNVTLLKTNGQDLPLAEQSCDFAVAREALCYVRDAALPGALIEIYRVLKSGGQFLLLDQVSVNPFWQTHPKAPNLVKRHPDFLRAQATMAGFIVETMLNVRSPRFPWIYPIRFGLLPRRSIPQFARWEVAWHRHFSHPTRRWWDALFVLRKPL